ncbi:Protein POF1B [Bagarius yarrelli]|uniref:Protein POF1B n=1 Tax=Bagarius yarrelli TaxID=175774 RepID=A0A556UYM8_BAGYA|nr:Protein POF1B [Bagarius yarrelli]
MTLPSAHSTTTLRTVSVSSEPSTATMLPPGRLNIAGGTTLRAVNVAPAQLSSVQYVNGATVDSSALQGNLRYLMPVQMQMPVQRASEYVVVNQAPQMLTPVYLHKNVQSVQSLQSVPNLQSVQNVQMVSVSKLDETDHLQQLPILSSSSSMHEVNIDVKNHLSSEVQMEFESDNIAKLDTRFFGELLAEVYRKNCDIHTCILDHVTKMGGRKQELDYKTRMMADKTMRMLLSTFSTLREDLVHLQDDLRRLESEKEQLERDLSFRADQTLQYDRLMESVRENNRQLQISLKESASAQRNLETQLMSSRSTDSSKDFRIKDLEGSKRALEQENQLLRKRLEGQSGNTTLQTRVNELSRHYEQMLKELREEKDKELVHLRYPILGLLSDDYKYTPSPVRESKTIVIKRTGEMTKKVWIKSRTRRVVITLFFFFLMCVFSLCRSSVPKTAIKKLLLSDRTGHETPPSLTYTPVSARSTLPIQFNPSVCLSLFIFIPLFCPPTPFSRFVSLHVFFFFFFFFFFQL